jgi:4-aminobutyrate aminotransferase-like enzyme
VNRTAERVVRMLPPLTVTAAEIEEAAGILDGALRAVSVEEVKA